MSSFKDMVASDRDIFLNIDEFGEFHKVEGVRIKAVIDDYALIESKSGARLGIAASALILYAKSGDLPEERAAGESLSIDGKEYTVESWAEDMGITSVTLSQQRTA